MNTIILLAIATIATIARLITIDEKHHLPLIYPKDVTLGILALCFCCGIVAGGLISYILQNNI